jgi:phosphomannomutase/phosphoglucomutase
MNALNINQANIATTPPPPEIFRAYDIRGIVGNTLTPETVYDIGRALGTTVLKLGEKTVVIGRDGRLSGPSLIFALAQGILSTGCNVVDIGMVPTPVLYFATHYLKIPSGVIITGSHNPPDYNGLKIMIGGKAIYGEEIQKLYQRIQSSNFSHGLGKLTEETILEAYIKTIQSNIQISKPLKVVIDCGNGVAGVIAQSLYQTLGCEVIPLYCEVDGRFPNHHPDPGQPENLQDLRQAVLTHKADIGLAFDGDADRLGVVDNQGTIIWPDRLLILFAEEVLSRNPKATIIFDVKCTRHVNDAITKMGGRPLMWKTGHSLIKAKMQETAAQLAGEMSGHVFFKDRWYGFDDGLYAGARLLEILGSAHQSAAELFSALPNSINTPELTLSIEEATKFETVQKLVDFARFQDAQISTIDGLRVDFRDGFGLVRPSNTGPNLILRFEGDTPLILERIKTQFRELLLSVVPQWVLPF